MLNQSRTVGDGGQGPDSAPSGFQKVSSRKPWLATIHWLRNSSQFLR